MLELATVFDNLDPDVVVTIADRYETLATAAAASYMNIPVAHVQGGEVTGSIDEKVRHAVTKLANIHLVCTEPAAQRVARMGESPDHIYVTGCPSIDLAREVAESPTMAFDPIAKYGGVGEQVDLTRGYIVVLQHPVTTEYESARHDIEETLHAVRDAGVPALWFWPNVDAGSDGTSKGIRSFRETEHPTNIHFFKNMAPTDFLRLLMGSWGIVGNSSVAIRECSYLGVPAVNVGSRQSGRDRGPNVVDVPHDRAAILRAIHDVLGPGRRSPSLLYGNGAAGERIADVLSSAPLVIEKRLTY
jgi:UDP-hydrolysing UDP-N-acetyl-D-glucosamine 2-epimerase